jgi:hypothetical protein
VDWENELMRYLKPCDWASDPAIDA